MVLPVNQPAWVESFLFGFLESKERLTFQPVLLNQPRDICIYIYIFIIYLFLFFIYASTVSYTYILFLRKHLKSRIPQPRFLMLGGYDQAAQLRSAADS